MTKKERKAFKALVSAAEVISTEADETGGHTRTVSRHSVDRLRTAIREAKEVPGYE